MYEMLYLPPLIGSTISTILVHTLETKTGLTLLLVLSILDPKKKDILEIYIFSPMHLVL